MKTAREYFSYKGTTYMIKRIQNELGLVTKELSVHTGGGRYSLVLNKDFVKEVLAGENNDYVSLPQLGGLDE